MPYQVVNYRVTQYFATEAEASATNPILLEGETWIEKDPATGRRTGRTKTGDGVLNTATQIITGTAFNDLPFDPGGTGPGGPVAAASVSFAPTGTIAATNVQAAIAELDGDARMSDPRTPTDHAGSHAAGGDDPITLSQGQVTGLADALAGKVDNDDPALTNAREWTASEVEQPESEAGVATTPRKWSALRVRQNVQAWWANVLLVAGKIPATYLPSYVDDIIEVANFAALPLVGESGKIYVTLDDNAQHRWSGSAYITFESSPGSTDAVAEGSVNLYFTAARAIAAVTWGTLTGIPAWITGSSAFGQGFLGLANQAAARAYIGAQPLTFDDAVIPYAATIDLDLAALSGLTRTIFLTGPLTLTTSNRAPGLSVSLRLVCDGTTRALNLPLWVFLGPSGTKPSSIAASKTAKLSVECYGAAETDCLAAYGVQG
jgi:hypothetical protein